MSRYYPPVGFYFSVAFTGVSTRSDASFREVSGLSAETDTETISMGGENRFSYRVPTRTTYANLVMKRGLMVASSDLATWCKTTLESGLNAAVTPKDVDVSLLDPDGTPLMTWNVKRAYPVKWSLSDLNAQENALAIETLEFAFTYFTKDAEEDLGLTGLF